MTTHEEEVRGLNTHLASMRSALNKSESERTKLMETMSQIGLNTQPLEKVTERLCELLEAEEIGKTHRSILRAYEGEMRYRITPCNDDYYAAPEALVVDDDSADPVVVCGCDNMADAAKVAAALNRADPKKTTYGSRS